MTDHADQSDEYGATAPLPLQPKGGPVSPIPPLQGGAGLPALPLQGQTDPYQQATYQQAPYQQGPSKQPSYQQAPYQQVPYQQPPIVQQTTYGPTVVMYGGPQQVVVAPRKSVFVALLLTFFFGPLGLFYVTMSGALIMLAVNLALYFVTLGFGWFITWPICMIWGAAAASSHNSRLRSGAYVVR